MDLIKSIANDIGLKLKKAKPDSVFHMTENKVFFVKAGSCFVVTAGEKMEVLINSQYKRDEDAIHLLKVVKILNDSYYPVRKYPLEENKEFIKYLCKEYKNFKFYLEKEKMITIQKENAQEIQLTNRFIESIDDYTIDSVLQLLSNVC